MGHGARGSGGGTRSSSGERAETPGREPGAVRGRFGAVAGPGGGSRGHPDLVRRLERGHAARAPEGLHPPGLDARRDRLPRLHEPGQLGGRHDLPGRPAGKDLPEAPHQHLDPRVRGLAVRLLPLPPGGRPRPERRRLQPPGLRLLRVRPERGCPLQGLRPDAAPSRPGPLRDVAGMGNGRALQGQRQRGPAQGHSVPLLPLRGEVRRDPGDPRPGQRLFSAI